MDGPPLPPKHLRHWTLVCLCITPVVLYILLQLTIPFLEPLSAVHIHSPPPLFLTLSPCLFWSLSPSLHFFNHLFYILINGCKDQINIDSLFFGAGQRTALCLLFWPWNMFLFCGFSFRNMEQMRSVLLLCSVCDEQKSVLVYLQPLKCSQE